MYEVFQHDVLSRNISKYKNGEVVSFYKQAHLWLLTLPLISVDNTTRELLHFSCIVLQI